MRISRLLPLAVSMAMVAGLTTLAGPARAATLVLRAVDDASAVAAQPSVNFGSARTLLTDRSPSTEAFLGFSVGAFPGPLTQAVLRLYVVDRTVDGPEIWLADAFEEETLTWANRPGTRTRLADPGSVAAGGWLEVNVTAVVTGAGTYSFAMVPDSSDGMDVNSDEASSNRPELVLQFGDTPPTSSTSTSSSTSSSTTTTTAPSSSGGTFSATDDAYIGSSSPDANFGRAVTLESDASPLTRALLAFRVPEMSRDVTRARLRVFATDSSGNGPELWRADPFDEDSVTWRSSPTPIVRLADVGSISRNSWVEYDVTSTVVGEGTYGFALVADSTDGSDFASDEAGVNRPQLVVETGQQPPPPPPPSGDTFQIGLIGDTGYTSTQERALLDTRDDMARFPLAFVVHDGDIWRGGSSCTESRFRSIQSVFNSFEGAFVYTPGDNDWKDCTSASGRLGLLRDIFYPSSKTLGKNPMTVTRQGAPYVENARWTHGGVVFATINEPGSSGAGGSHRDANLKWLHAAFDLAEDTNAPGVMVIWQDNSFVPSGGALYRALKERAAAFRRPVVLVHGDTHSQRIDRPWSGVGNFTRVETFGTNNNGDWIRAAVDPKSAAVFSFIIERP